MEKYTNKTNTITLYNGNCINVMDDMINKDIKVSLIITEPPYLHNKGGGKTHGTEGKSKIANSSMYNFDSPMMKNMSSFGEKEVNDFLDRSKKLMNKFR